MAQDHEGGNDDDDDDDNDGDPANRTFASLNN